MNRLRKASFVLAVLVLACLLAPGGLAQETGDACPALVLDAIERAGEACAGLGRNEACYGHFRVQAMDWQQETLDAFLDAGNTIDVATLAALTTFPLDVEDESWGIAVLALQADLPDTQPGQNVTFVVFGEAELSSDNSPQEQAAPPTCTASANSDINVRSGPGTGYAILGGLAQGDTITVNGRDEAGDWLRFNHDGANGWVFADLVALNCAVDSLQSVGNDDAVTQYSGPMQAFSLTMPDFGDPVCDEAPRDGVLVQAPTGTTVHFLINGIEVEVGSTGFLYTEGSTLVINTLDGLVSATSAGQSEAAAPGESIAAQAGQSPSTPQPFALPSLRNLPLDLLPEPVQLPPPTGSGVSVAACEARGGLTASSGQPLVINLGWATADAASMADYLDVAALSLSYDGEALPVWTMIGPTERDDGSYVVRHYWVIPAPEPGEHTIEGQYLLTQPISDGTTDENGDLTVLEGALTATCAVTVLPAETSQAPAPAPTTAPPPALSSSASFTVSGNAMTCVDSGFAVRQGQPFTLAASGEVDLLADCETACTLETCPGICPNFHVGPAGLGLFSSDLSGPAPVPDRADANVPAPDQPVGSLLGRIGAGGSIFGVGNGGTFTASASGTLFFCINDSRFLDNGGAFIVVIEAGG